MKKSKKSKKEKDPSAKKSKKNKKQKKEVEEIKEVAAAPTERIVTCFNCGQQGHMSQNCQQDARLDSFRGSDAPSGDQGGSGFDLGIRNNKSQKRVNILSKNRSGLQGPVERVCWHCGEKGHRRNDCPERPVDPNMICFGCRQKGHTLSKCPNTTGGGSSAGPAKVSGGVSCYNCGDPGHASRNCKKPNSNFAFAVCFICNEKGHLASRCPQSKKGLYPRGGGCYVCGSNTHLARNCPGPVILDNGENNTENGDNKAASTEAKVAPRVVTAIGSSTSSTSSSSSSSSNTNQNTSTEQKVQDTESLDDDGFEVLEAIPVDPREGKKKRKDRDSFVKPKKHKKRRY